jgi:hypothetical protein
MKLCLPLLLGLLTLAGCRDGREPDTGRSLVIWEMEDAAVAPYIDSVLAAFRKLP